MLATSGPRNFVSSCTWGHPHSEQEGRHQMLTLHVSLSFFGLLVGALLIGDLLRSARRQRTLAAVLLLSTALISITGFALPSPPGTPTPDPARILGVIELVLIVIAVLALYLKHLARAWRNTYIVSIVLAAYLNVFVAVVQAFLKVSFLRVLAPSGKEPPFVIAQLLTLVLFVVIGALALKRPRSPAGTIKATI